MKIKEFVYIEKTEYEELKKKAEDAAVFFRENQILHSENVIASQIQRGMLPGEKEIYDDNIISLYGDMDAAKDVGGDFYDFIFLDANHLFFCIGDVSGKGVPAIIHMVACKILLRSQAKRLLEGIKLEDIFYDINLEIFQMTKKKQFVTCFAGVYNLKTGHLRYVNAGHTRTLICNGLGINELVNVSGMPLGAYFNVKKPERCKYHEYDVYLKKDDMLFMYTDGCIEAMNSKGEAYGINNMMKVINSSFSRKSFSEVITYLQRSINKFENHEEQDDDQTILALKIKGMKE